MGCALGAPARRGPPGARPVVIPNLTPPATCDHVQRVPLGARTEAADSVTLADIVAHSVTQSVASRSACVELSRGVQIQAESSSVLEAWVGRYAKVCRVETSPTSLTAFALSAVASSALRRENFYG